MNHDIKKKEDDEPDEEELVRENREDCLAAYLSENSGINKSDVTDEELALWRYQCDEMQDEYGVFYLSYYDRVYSNPAALEMEARGGISNEELLMYDYLGMSSCTSPEQSEESGTIANAFQADPNRSRQLKHVSVFTGDCGSHVDVEIYLLNANAKNPVDGSLVHRQEGSFDWAGYHIICINKKLLIPAGRAFSVVVKTFGSTGRPYTPFEYGGTQTEVYDDGNECGYEYIVKDNQRGTSFILTSSGWKDLKDYDIRNLDLDVGNAKAGNAMIRAFVSNPDPVSISDAQISGLGTMTYTGAEIKPVFQVKVNGKDLIRDRDYNYVVVCYDNVNAGTAKVHITFSNMYKGTLTTTFKIKRGKQSITTSRNSYTVNYSSVQKKDQIINLKADAKTCLSYTSSNKKYITVSKGKAKVKKGTPKGTYTVTIKAKATKNCKEKTKKVNIVVK